MHLAWRWFTGLGFDQEIPHYSSCSSSCLRTSWRLPGGGTGARGQSVGRWQFRGGQCQQGEPNPAGAVSGSGRGEPNRAPVPGGTGAAEPHRRALAPARPGIDHRSRCDLRDQGWNSRPAGLLRQLPGGQSQRWGREKNWLRHLSPLWQYQPACFGRDCLGITGVRPE
jgi:hypothetical protein